MSVFTVFNHGTDFHRDKQSNELITILSNAMIGDEAIIIPNDLAPLGYSLKYPAPNYIICEGPGSDTVSAQDSESNLAHTRPGGDNPITRSQAKNGLMSQQTTLKSGGFWGNGGNKDFQRDFYGDTPKPWQLSGRVSGKGWDDSSYRVAWMLTHLLFSQNLPIDTVNLVGWSRGAVTCLKQANLLNEVLPQLKLNILAIDPVPGKDPSEHEDDTKVLSSNVQTYWAILALNERRENFRCIDPAIFIPQAGNQTWIEFLPMPGNHSDLVRPNSDVKESISLETEQDYNGWRIPKSYRISMNIAHRFLSYFGTDLRAVDQPNNMTCLSYYNEMKRQFGQIKSDYEDATSIKDVSSYKIGRRYADRSILTEYMKVQEHIPQQDGCNDNPYFKYVMKGWFNIHHWILAKNAGQPEPDLDHPYIGVDNERIQRWERWLKMI